MVCNHHPYLVCGMTLYQRIYASKGKKKRKSLADCWCIRMAYYGIYGVILGMLAKVAASQVFAGITDAKIPWIAKWDYQFY
jgi:hypothetical protein